MEEQFWSVINSPSSKPFHVNTGKGNIWYYLKHETDSKLISGVVGDVHNCQSCRRNSKIIAGYFGPTGYAVNFGNDSKFSDCYDKLEDSRILSRTNSKHPSGVMIVTDESILTPRRSYQKDYCEKASEFAHFSFNMKPEYITDPGLCSGISDVLLKKLTNGSMDVRLEEIITNLQLSSDGINSDMTMLESALDDKRLLRKDFWKYRIDYAKRVQKYASRFPNGKSFKDMDNYHKMHVRIFALFYGGSYSYSENLSFKAVSHLVDCSKDVFNGGTLVTFMNSRSDPDTYMVQQVARALEQNSVRSRYTVSLAWSSASDLDLWVKTPGGEIVNHTNRESKTCGTRLDFDANAQDDDCMENPVENITLDHEKSGVYGVYVNNFRSRNGETHIPFMIIVTLDGEREIFENSWVVKKNKQSGKLKDMVNVTSVYISDMMVRRLKPPEMSEKKVRVFTSLLDGFTGAFGNIKTDIVDLNSSELVELTKRVDVNRDRVIERNIRGLNRLQLGNIRVRTTMSQRTGGDYTKMSELFSAEVNLRISINGKDFPPSVMTRHSCSNVLKVETGNMIVSTYYEKGHVPTKPNPERRFVFSRIDNEWHPKPRINIIAMTKLHRGYFLTIENPRLPKPNSEWILSAGMYVDDLKTEYHKFREMWRSHHIKTPISITRYTTPTIGVFLCHGNSYRLCVNGIDMVIKSD